MKNIMLRAWELRKAKGYTMATALRLAWREARGEKGYTFIRPTSGTCLSQASRHQCKH